MQTGGNPERIRRLQIGRRAASPRLSRAYGCAWVTSEFLPLVAKKRQFKTGPRTRPGAHGCLAEVRRKPAAIPGEAIRQATKFGDSGFLMGKSRPLRAVIPAPGVASPGCLLLCGEPVSHGSRTCSVRPAPDEAFGLWDRRSKGLPDALLQSCSWCVCRIAMSTETRQTPAVASLEGPSG